MAIAPTYSDGSALSPADEAARTRTTVTEQGTVTVIKAATSDRELRAARRNTRPDGSQVVIYVSTSRRVAPAVAATFVPDAEVAQPSQLEPAGLEQHLAQQDELLDSDGAKALENEVAHAQADEAYERQLGEQAEQPETAPAAPAKHRITWWVYDSTLNADGTKARTRAGVGKRGSSRHGYDVECSCGDASRTGGAVGSVMRRAVREHKDHGQAL